MAQEDWYVDPGASGGGTGVDWTNAYTSLSAAEAAKQKDLVAAGDNVVFHCRDTSGSGDTSKVRFDGWTTAAADDIAVEVLAANRHTGKAATGYYIVAAGGFDPLFGIREDFVTVDGVAVENTQTGQTGAHGFMVRSIGVGVRNFLNCLANDCGNHGYFVNDTDNANYFINCIAFNCGISAAGGSGFETQNDDLFYNCNSINNSSGTSYAGDGFSYSGFGTAILTNCVAGLNDGTDYVTSAGSLTLTTCYDDDGTGNTTTTIAVGAGTYFTNVTPGSDDINLTSTLSSLYNVGTDLSADGTFPFNYDYAGTTRTVWNVGAHEYTAVVSGNPWYYFAQQ